MIPFAPPSAADLIARYPAFAGVAPAAIQAVITDAELDVGENWICAHRVPAILALAAHRLVAEGALASADAKDINGGLAAITTMRAGDHELKFADPNRSEVIEATGYARTPYGRRFLELRARSFPAVVAV